MRLISSSFPVLITRAHSGEMSSDNQAKPTPVIEYEVRTGDNLSKIFDKFDIKYSELTRLNDADTDYLYIDTIMPGDILRFWIKNDELKKFEVEFNISSKVVFTRKDKGFFQAKKIDIEGDWERTVMMGNIKSNFFLSAKEAGLTYKEQKVITEILKDKINFTRDLRPGDEFEVISNVHFVGDKLTGQSEILAVRFKLKKRLVSAYLHTDGNYYDEQGESLQGSSFLRYPLEKEVRVSSHFNPKRKHPVSKLNSPHNGTDFAVDIGTPVVSTADGVVTLVRDHMYAGKYVVIDHGTQFRTRYLHNSKILVKVGDKVKRGQRIALSGNSGRTTGAHLHYEVLIKGRPVDAMRANIPVSITVPNKELKDFKKQVQDFSNMLKRQTVAKLG